MFRIEEPAFPTVDDAIPGVRVPVEAHTGTGTAKEENAVVQPILWERGKLQLLDNIGAFTYYTNYKNA